MIRARKVGFLPATDASSDELRFGAVVAFTVSTVPFALFGITPAFWAIVAGLVASVVVEREQLVGFWRGSDVAQEG